jgi:DNA gyrase subunit A
MDDEDLIAREDMVVTVSTPATSSGCRWRPTGRSAAAARAARACNQGRGFRHPAVCCQHAHAGAVLLLARHGYKMKVWRCRWHAPQARGKALVNLLPLEEGERITTIMPLPEDEDHLG